VALLLGSSCHPPPPWRPGLPFPIYRPTSPNPYIITKGMKYRRDRIYRVRLIAQSYLSPYDEIIEGGIANERH